MGWQPEKKDTQIKLFSDVYANTINFIYQHFFHFLLLHPHKYVEPLIREKLMSGKLLIEWRHDLCFEITKKRYINDQEVMRSAHAEIVNLFFPQETSDESDEINSETSDKSSKLSFVLGCDIISS